MRLPDNAGALDYNLIIEFQAFRQPSANPFRYSAFCGHVVYIAKSPLGLVEIYVNPIARVALRYK
jgi:hypothetical protein